MPLKVACDNPTSGAGSGSLSSGLRAQVYSGYFNDNLSFFGTVGGSSQHSSSSIRNRFVNDFTRVNYTTPGRNFAEYYSAEWRGFFKPPRVKKNIKIDETKDYSNSLLKSVEYFLFHVMNKKKFSDKITDTSFKSNSLITK